jgi:hypothetical protein
MLSQMQQSERQSGRSETLLSIAIMLGLLHHIDHVLRFDHSGWPFRTQVTPFTFSLLAYPLLPQSTFLGYVAVVLSILLSVALVFATVSLFIDARRQEPPNQAMQQTAPRSNTQLTCS